MELPKIWKSKGFASLETVSIILFFFHFLQIFKNWNAKPGFAESCSIPTSVKKTSRALRQLLDFVLFNSPYRALRLYSVHQHRGIFVQCLNSLSCFSIIWIERDGQVAVVVVATVVAAVTVAVVLLLLLLLLLYCVQMRLAFVQMSEEERYRFFQWIRRWRPN